MSKLFRPRSAVPGVAPFAGVPDQSFALRSAAPVNEAMGQFFAEMIDNAIIEMAQRAVSEITEKTFAEAVDKAQKALLAAAEKDRSRSGSRFHPALTERVVVTGLLSLLAIVLTLLKVSPPEVAGIIFAFAPVVAAQQAIKLAIKHATKHATKDGEK
jgi:hypothetical protein